MTEKRKFPSLIIGCNIDERTFFRFAAYDSLIRQKAWRSPALFAFIMSVSALICFLGRARHEQALLIGGVLLGIGLALPLVWLGMFFASLNRQAKRSGLSCSKVQYTVTLSPDRIHVTNEKEAADFSWDCVYMARRVKDCIYLYVSPKRAFLLPEGEKSTQAWEIITASLHSRQIQNKMR